MTDFKIESLNGEFSVCRVSDFTPQMMENPFTFLARTNGECSLVCLTADVPQQTQSREDGWRAFRVVGVLDFSLIGILSRISTRLADAGIGIFAVSTYNTDYILVKQENYTKACLALEEWM